MRPLRRCAAISPGLARSAFGQASSNDGGGWAGSSSGAMGDLERGSGRLVDRAWHSRALFASRGKRNCLRFRTAWRWRWGHRSEEDDTRTESFATAAVRCVKGAAAGEKDPEPPGCSSPRKPPPAGAESRVPAPASPGRPMASPRASGKPAVSRRAMFFNSRTVIQSASMMAPVQTPITPAIISVLPVLNSLIGIPKPIASRPATTRPIPAINMTNIIELTLSRARTLASRPRHDTVILCAPPPPIASGVPNSVVRLQDSSRGRSYFPFRYRSARHL